MQQFGEVIQIHKPPTSGDPKSDVATVRFAKQEQAEAAVAFLKSGNALLNGTPISGDWKTQAKGGRPSSGVLDYDAPIVDSRSFLPGGSRRERSRSRRGTIRGSPRRDGSESRGRGQLRKKSRSRSRGPALPRAGPGNALRSEPKSSRGGPTRSASRGGRGGGVGRRDDSRSRGKASHGSAAGGAGARQSDSHGGRSRSHNRSRSKSWKGNNGRTDASGKDLGFTRQAPPAPPVLPIPPAPPASQGPALSGLSPDERAELESLRTMATEEEKEMEELRRMMAARDAAISQLEAKVGAKC